MQEINYNQTALTKVENVLIIRIIQSEFYYIPNYLLTEDNQNTPLKL